MDSRPGLLRTQFAYCRQIILIFLAATRSLLHTMHRSNTILILNTSGHNKLTVPEIHVLTNAGRTERRTHPLIEMRERIGKKVKIRKNKN